MGQIYNYAVYKNDEFKSAHKYRKQRILKCFLPLTN